MKPIPYGRQYITDEDIQAVVSVLKSDFLTQGPVISEFEEKFAEYVGARYAVAVSNGTAALHLCTLAMGVKPGDKVITTPITFAASANCIRYCGGEVVFADIDPETYLLDIDAFEALLESSPKGTYKGVIPVDFAGRAIDMQAFRKLADEYGLWIIEDSCHAPGGFFIDDQGNKQQCGNGQFADLAIFSFHPVKHIATGEGGMITTNNRELYKKLLMLRTHGITKDAQEFMSPIELAVGNTSDNRHSIPTDYPKWYMEMQTLGFNYRLTDFHAALGLSQLKRAEEGLKRRQEIAATYYESLKGIKQITDRNHELAKIEQQKLSSKNGNAYHLYVVEAQDRLGLYNCLRSKEIYVQIHYIPCHLMPYYQELGWKLGDLEHAERYYGQCISLPMYPTLSKTEQEFVIQTIQDFYQKKA